MTSLSMIPWLLRGDIFDQFEHAFERNPRAWYDESGFPVIDQFMEGDNVVLEFALAGYEQEALSIKYEDKALVVSAAKEDSDESRTFRKIAKRAFERKYIDKTGTLDLEKASATFKNGILRVEIPKKQKKESKTLRIEVKV